MAFKVFQKVNEQIYAFASHLSLKCRLTLAFSTLMIVAILFSMMLGLRQQHISVSGSALVIQAHHDLSVAIQMREALSEIDQSVRIGESSSQGLARFRYLIKHLESHSFSLESQKILINAEKYFNAYVKIVSTSKSKKVNEDVRAQYDKVAATINAFIEMNENFIYSLAEDLQKQQSKSMQLAIYLFFGFMLLVLVVSFKAISIIVNPISKLVKVLDDVNVEDDSPVALPNFGTTIPEVLLVVLSFERLFQRLKGYRALNVKRLLFEKRRADIIAASISDGIFLLRGEEVLYVNPIAEKILGLSSVMSLKGSKLSDQTLKINSAGLRAVMKAVSCTLPVEFTLEVDERKFYYLIQSMPLSNEVIEEVESSVGSVMTRLWEEFQANTLVLAQDVTLVRESQEAKGHFLATLSHEVKTPVTSLTLATRLLKRSVDQFQNPTHRNLILTCADDVDRLRGLLEDLLTVTRFETLTQQLEIQKVDLAKLIVHSVQSFKAQANERGIELLYQVVSHGKPVIVPMDASKITWALSNLIINALRHTPRGGKIDVRVESREEWIEVKITDTGAGIDKYRQDKIFEKFNPYYDLRVARSGSVGAGLAIAKEIIVAHGGRIWVVSEPGHGAEFYFTLPLRRSGTNIVTDESIHKLQGKFMDCFIQKSRFSL